MERPITEKKEDLKVKKRVIQLLATPKGLALKEYLNNMLNKGYIEQCIAEYTSPIVLVKKKDGEHAFVWF
jgi:hypothetical protein